MHKYVGTQQSSINMARAWILDRWRPQKTPEKYISALSFVSTVPINSLPKGEIFCSDWPQ